MKTHSLEKNYLNIPTPIWLLCAITLISKSGAMVLFFLPVYLTQYAHLSVSAMGVVLAFYGLGEIVGSYLGGDLSDRINALTVQTLSLFIEGICFLSLEFFHIQFQIIIILFVIGFMNAAARTAGNTNLARYCPPNLYAQAFALNIQAISLGVGISLIIAGALARLDYNWLFRISGLANITAAITLVMFFYNNKMQTYTIIKSINFKTQFFWKNKNFLAILALAILLGMCLLQVRSVYSVYLKEYYQLSVSSIGILFGLQSLLFILLQMPVTNFLKKYKKLQIIGYGGLIMTLGYVILPFSTSLLFAFLSIIIMTIGILMAIPFLYEYVINIAPSESTGRYIGMLNCAEMSIPLTISPIISSYIYSVFSPNALWFGTGVVGLIIMISFITLDKYSKNKMMVST